MTIVFTICSNNYLAQAKILKDSIHEYNPEYKIVIGLVDKLSEQIDYSFFMPTEILPVEEIGINNFNELTQRYDIIELNTSVKPSFFKYLSNKYSPNNIFYIDPDIKIYSPFEFLEKKLEKHSILLTPHIYTPIKLDGNTPNEQIFLSHGIYNLGFLGLNTKKEQAKKLLDWWEERCLQLCYRDSTKGLFVDQYWINFVPIYFSETYIIHNYGYNMGPWNLHERKIVKTENNKYYLNDESQLIFYHFSSYDYKKPEEINKPFYNRFSFENRPDLIDLYKDYYNELLKNKVEIFSKLKCEFIKETVPKEDKIIKYPFYKKFLKSIIPPIIYDSISLLKRKLYA